MGNKPEKKDEQNRRTYTRSMIRRHYKESNLELPPLCAWDIETDGLGGPFIIGAFVTNDDIPIRQLCYTLEDCLDFIVLHPEYRYLAHNAVGYEFAYLIPLLYQYFLKHEGVGIIPTLQGDNRIVQIRLTLENHPWIDLRDTLCLFPMSLEAVAKSFCPEMPKLKEVINFEKETFDINNPAHIEYVFRDCDIIIKAYTRHAQNIRDVFRSPIGVTAGSTAIKAFYTCIEKGKTYYRLRKEVEDFCRAGYYGGLVLPGHTMGEWGEITGVDVNAAYGFQMGKYEYPVGAGIHTISYKPGKTGIYLVSAKVSKDVFERNGFNPLPYRTKTGLCWPTGEFETTITHVEYDFALSCGCELEVIEGYYWTNTEPVFREFIKLCQDMEIFENGRYKQSIKPQRNSLYGKFGAKPSHKVLRYSKETLMEPGFVPLTDDDTRRIIEGVYIGEEEGDDIFMMPHWAALVTAYERVYLMTFIREAYRRGATNVYCDTDSIKTNTSVILGMIQDGVIPIGNNYGEFKVEEMCTSFLMLGPKCFYGKHPKGELLKAKGLPKRKLTPQLYLEASQGKFEAQHFVAVESVMNIIKRNSYVKPVKRKRKITDMKNSLSWDVDPETQRIYPYGYRQAGQ